MSSEDRVAVAERAARAGADVAYRTYRTGIDVETKDGKTDVVTQSDRDAQRRVIEVIRESFPDDAIVGEEDDELKQVPESGSYWVIDPIDGTNNYVRDIPIWATSVAAVADGEAVAAANVMPALDDAFVSGPDGATLNGDPIAVSEASDPDVFTVAPTIWWDFDHRVEYGRACQAIVDRFGDMRRFGCAQAVLSMVAAGQLEGALTNVVCNPWDTVAGVHLIRQAGGIVTDVHGDPWEPHCEGLVASNGHQHDLVLEAAQEIDPE